MAQETLKELKYNGKKVIAEVARRDALGRIIDTTYLTDVQLISEDEIDAAFETVFGKNTNVKKFLDATKSAYYLFYNYKGTSVDDLIKYNDTSNVTKMTYMFSDCSNLTTIPQLDTSKVTSMYATFSNCTSLTTIPQLDTSKVTSMYAMFRNCTSLTAIPQLDTSKVTDMSATFNNCTSLTTIPQLDTSKVTDMSDMFYNCISLTKISMLNINARLDISDCTKMTREAIVEVLNNLKDLTGLISKTLTLGSTLLGKLTDEDKAIATNKNWTLA